MNYKSKNQKHLKRTDLLSECKDIIETNNVLVVSGKTGYGKTTLCMDVLEELECNEYKVYILKYPYELSGVEKVVDESVDETPIVFIDDLEIDKHFDEGGETWDIKKMIDLSDNGSIKLLISISQNALRNILDDDCLFNHSMILDISSDQWSLTYEEKYEIFHMYYECPSYKGQTLTEDVIDQMLNCNPVFGFFKTCYDFFECSDNLNDGLTFFKSSEIDFIEKVDNLFSHSLKSYAFLVTLLQKQGVEIGSDFDIGFHRNLDALNIPSDNIDLDIIIVHLMENGFIKRYSSSLYKFSCIFAEDSVLQSFARNYTMLLFENCDFNFIYKYVRPSSYVRKRNEICVCIDSKFDTRLASTILKKIDLGSLQVSDENHHCLNHPAFKSDNFSKIFMHEMQQTLSRDDLSKYSTEILNWSCCYGRRNLASTIMNIMVESENMTKEIMNNALKSVSYCDYKCPEILYLFLNSQLSSLVESETIVQLISTASKIGFSPKCLRSFLADLNLSGKIVGDLISMSIAKKEIGHTKVLLHESLVSKLSKQDRVELLLRCVDIHIDQHLTKHLRESILSVDCPWTDFCKVFDKYVASYSDIQTCITLLKTWLKHRSGTDYIPFILDSLLVKPMSRQWYCDYIQDEVIKSILVNISIPDFMVIMKKANNSEANHPKIRNLLIGCRHMVEHFVSVFKKVFVDDHRFLAQVLKVLPFMLSGSSTKSNISTAPTMNGSKNEEIDVTGALNLFPTVGNEPSGTEHGLFVDSINLVPDTAIKSTKAGSMFSYPQLKYERYTEQEQIILSSVFCFDLIGSTESFDQKSTYDRQVLQSTTNILVLLLSTLNCHIFSVDYCLTLIDSVLSNETDVISEILSKILTAENLKFDISFEKGISISQTAFSLETPSLLRNLLHCRKLKVTKHFFMYLLLRVNELSGDFGKKCLDILISFMISDEREFDENIQCILLSLACDSRFVTGNEECHQLILRSLNAAKRISNKTLQLLLSKLMSSDHLSSIETEMIKTYFDRTKLPKVTTSTVGAIVRYASEFGIKDKNCLTFILRKSNIRRMACSKLLYLLKLAITHKSYTVIKALVFSKAFQKTQFDDSNAAVAKDLCCTVLLMFYLRTGNLQSLNPFMSMSPFHLISVDLTDCHSFLRSMISVYTRIDQTTYFTLLKYMIKSRKTSDVFYFDVLLEKIDRHLQPNATFTRKILQLLLPRNDTFNIKLQSLVDVKLDEFVYDVIALLNITVEATSKTSNNDTLKKTSDSTAKLNFTSSGDDTLELLYWTDIHDKDIPKQTLEQCMSQYVRCCKHLIASPLHERLTGAEAAMVFSRCLYLHDKHGVFPERVAKNVLECVLPHDITSGYAKRFLSTFIRECRKDIISNEMLFLEALLPCHASMILEEDIVVSVLCEIFVQIKDSTINIDHDPFLFEDRESKFNKCIILLIEYLLCNNIRKTRRFRTMYKFQSSTFVSPGKSACAYALNFKFGNQLILSCTVELSRKEDVYLTIQSNVITFRLLRDCLSDKAFIPVLSMFLFDLGKIEPDSFNFDRMVNLFRLLSMSPLMKSYEGCMHFTTEHYSVHCRATDIMLWNIQYNIVDLGGSIDESAFCSVFRPGQYLKAFNKSIKTRGDQCDYNAGDWYRKCLSELVDSPKINDTNPDLRKTMLWKTYFLLRITNKSGSEIEVDDCRYDRNAYLGIYDIQTMNMVIGLSNIERVGIIQTFMKLSSHDFILPLLSQEVLMTISHTEFIDIMAHCRYTNDGSVASCSFFQIILLLFDKFSDIDSNTTYHHDQCCDTCIETILLSSAVKSASRGTALYLIKVSIANDISDYTKDLIASTLCSKLEESDKLNAVKQLILPSTFTGTYHHDFVSPLLSSAKLTHMTNNAFLHILMNFKRSKFNYSTSAKCDMLQSILHVVDQLGDISTDDEPHCCYKWCEKCAKTILLSSAVTSASRRAALYLITGIIHNGYEDYMRDVIESTLCRKLEEHDRLNTVQQLIQFCEFASGEYYLFSREYGHHFLKPLMSSANLTHITNKTFLYIIMNCRRDNDHMSICDMLHSILHAVAELGDISIDNTYIDDEWCEECTKTILMSSAVKSASRGTSLYLINGIIHNGLEEYMYNIIEFTLCTKLEEFDKQIAVKQLIQSYTFTMDGHSFLLPLLSSHKWLHITNKSFLDIMIKCRRDSFDEFKECDMFQSILSVVNELGDISTDEPHCYHEWCEKCTNAILISSAVKSASRGTSLYLINGIIHNCILYNINGVITLGSKLQEYDIEDVVMQLRQSDAYAKGGGHDFLQPLLSNVTWTQKTNKEYLINLSRSLFNDGYCSRVALLRCILLNVEELSDIGSDNRDRRCSWCEDCLREVLMSSAVKICI